MSKNINKDVSRQKLQALEPNLCLKLPQPRNYRWLPYVVLVVALLLTASAANYVASTAKVQERLRFENAVQRTQDNIQKRLETYIALLRAGSSLFAASDRVSRDEFRAFVNHLDLQHRYPGIQGIGFSLRVMPQEKDALVAELHRQGVENFTWRPGFKRAEYHSIIYLEPLNRRNKTAIGFDMFTEAVRRAAMERARDTGVPAASGRVTLVQEIDKYKQAGFLIYVPVYRNGNTPNTVTERRKALRGFVYSPFRSDDLLTGILGNEKQPEIDFQLYDGTQLSDQKRLDRFRQNTESSSSSLPRLTTIKTINVAGQTWSILFVSRPQFELATQSSLVPYIWLAGLAISFLLFGVTRLQVRAWQQVQQLNASLERQVTERTAQLQQALDFKAMIARITDKVRDSLNESQILNIAIQELVLTLGVICCDTALYNLADGTSNICYQYTGISNQDPSRWNSATPSSIGRRVQMTDFPDGYRQLLQGQYFQFCEITPDVVRSQVAILACPIVDDQGVLGDLWLFNYKEYAFNELEIRLVQQVANQCAIAIRQARLYTAATMQVQELEKLNDLKDEFLSTVSHELRTPIANMKMAIQMLKLSPTAEKSQRYLEILQAECTRESELINELLDLQRLEAGSYAILLGEAINLQEMLSNLVEPFRVRTGQRQQTLQINLPSDLPPLVSDRASLERVLAELLNNACKYTPAGGDISLSVCKKSTEAATIFIISNPAEIPSDQLPRIFEKFYRVPKGDRWKQGGTGLGLALAQKLVEHLKGTIKVESSNGWTIFSVELPNQPTS